jgi:hypothetical protein
MKFEIKHEGFCLGATGVTGRLIVRDALAKGHSVPGSPRVEDCCSTWSMLDAGGRQILQRCHRDLGSDKLASH